MGRLPCVILDGSAEACATVSEVLSRVICWQPSENLLEEEKIHQLNTWKGRKQHPSQKEKVYKVLTQSVVSVRTSLASRLPVVPLKGGGSVPIMQQRREKSSTASVCELCLHFCSAGSLGTENIVAARRKSCNTSDRLYSIVIIFH